MSIFDEDFKARHIACTIWTVLIGSSLTLVLLLFSNISLSAPWTWIMDMIYMMPSFPFISFLLINIIFLSLLVHIFKGFLTFSDTVYLKRTNFIERLIKYKVLRFTLLCSLLAATTAIFFNKLLFSEETSSVFYADPNSDDGLMINEKTICIIIFGFFIGIVFAWRLFLCNMLTIVFIDTQESLIDSILTIILSLLPNTIRMSLKQVPVFFLFYFFVRNVHWILSIFFMIEIKIESFFSIFNPYQFLHLVLIGSYIQFTWLVGLHLLKLYSARTLPLLLTNLIFPEDTIEGHLQKPNSGIFKHLLFKRLYQLCATSMQCRQEIFALSELGEQPHLWNIINKRCMGELQEFLIKIKCANSLLLNKGDIPRTVALQRTTLPKHLRVRLHLADLSPMKVHTDEKNAKKNMAPISHLLFDFLISLAPVRYMTGELPFSKTMTTFSSGQLVVWTTRILACLVASSYEEDEFGVVQKDLPGIFALLAELNECVEKHLKLSGLFGVGSSYSLSPMLDGLYSDHSLPWRVRDALNYSLRTMVTRFGKDVDSIDLAPPIRQLLEPFKESSSV